MRLAIMQPYFLPYLGYFQLMSSVDKFILLDDVNFINRGWINRNRIAVNETPHWMTLPLIKASQNRLINEIEIADDPTWRRKILRTVELSYQRAPYRGDILPLLSDIWAEREERFRLFCFASCARSPITSGSMFR